jgi:APA family basic amino acid/polyamine antiporter
LVYILVAGLLTGIMYFPDLNTSSPVALALMQYGHHFSAQIVAIGAIAGLTTAIMAMYFGFTRVFLAMARDGFLPRSTAKICPKSGTPKRLVWTVGLMMAIAAGFFPIASIANLVNIGALAAFVAVCASAMILRYTQPDLPRPFKTPFGPLFPIMGILLCCYLMTTFAAITWLSFALWTLGGLVLYFVYSKKNSLKTP